MKHKQKQSWGCGLYAVANACNLDNFINSKRLQEDGHDLYIEVLYYNHLGKKLPSSTFDYKPEGEKVIALPVLISCRFSENGLNHMIGGKIGEDGKLYLYDSLKDEMIETTLSKVNKMYHNVYGLYLLASVSDGSYAFIA